VRGDARRHLITIIFRNEAGIAASKLLEASTGLSSQSEQLKIELDGFLGSIRAA
jgi:methyl-accepting chemotaxis protein